MTAFLVYGLVVLILLLPVSNQHVCVLGSYSLVCSEHSTTSVGRLLETVPFSEY